MKKIFPLVALLTTVAFSAPSFAAEEADAAPAATAKEAHKEVHKAGHAKHAAKGKAHKHGKKGKKPCHHKISGTGEGAAMEAAPATAVAPTKVWMPSMRHGFQK